MSLSYPRTSVPLAGIMAGSARLYFAYGSNLSFAQMHSRCPSSAYVGLGRLRKWEWIIGERGYANIVPSSYVAPGKDSAVSGPRNEVWGLIYELDPDRNEDYGDEESLDQAEGVPWAYQKVVIDVEVVRFEGKTRGSEDEDKTQLGSKTAGAAPAHDDANRIETTRCLVYVDELRLDEGRCREEYVFRMNRGISDATECGMPTRYVDAVLRPFVRETPFVAASMQLEE